MKLSVILSFKNEEEALPELFTRINKVMAGIGDDYEYIFINDASTDRSLEMLMERTKTDRHIKIVNTSRSFGHDECVFAGFKYSTGDAAVILAADCQDPPELITKMWEEFKNGAEVVYTTRLSRPGESRFKMFVTKIAYKALFKMTKVIVPESGDFRMISRPVINEILKLEERNPFVRGLTFWIGFKHKQLFYHREARVAGDCHFPLFRGGPERAFLNGLISFSRWPLYNILKLGVLFSGVATLAGLTLLIVWIFGKPVAGLAIMTTVLFFLSGIHLLALGAVGLYAASAYDESRKRPNYIVRSTYGFDTLDAQQPSLTGR